MMEVAERDGLVQIGSSAAGPGIEMVQLAPGEGPLAAVGGAGLMVDSERGALSVVEQPGPAPEIQGE